jgi:hypothetical protein
MISFVVITKSNCAQVAQSLALPLEAISAESEVMMSSYTSYYIDARLDGRRAED